MKLYCIKKLVFNKKPANYIEPDTEWPGEYDHYYESGSHRLLHRYVIVQYKDRSYYNLYGLEALVNRGLNWPSFESARDAAQEDYEKLVETHLTQITKLDTKDE